MKNTSLTDIKILKIIKSAQNAFNKSMFTPDDFMYDNQGNITGAKLYIRGSSVPQFFSRNNLLTTIGFTDADLKQLEAQRRELNPAANNGLTPQQFQAVKSALLSLQIGDYLVGLQRGFDQESSYKVISKDDTATNPENVLQVHPIGEPNKIINMGLNQLLMYKRAANTYVIRLITSLDDTVEYLFNGLPAKIVQKFPDQGYIIIEVNKNSNFIPLDFMRIQALKINPNAPKSRDERRRLGDEATQTIIEDKIDAADRAAQYSNKIVRVRKLNGDPRIPLLAFTKDIKNSVFGSGQTAVYYIDSIKNNEPVLGGPVMINSKELLVIEPTVKTIPTQIIRQIPNPTLPRLSDKPLRQYFSKLANIANWLYLKR